ncbi:MAG: NUDIX hydrolase [Patescibacteria group bacterium]|nr:NUDIX hydrolase [Patescibacteria group bacterium]
MKAKKSTKNPWKVLSSRVAYQSPFIKVVEDKVVTPEGKEGIHNIIFGGSGNYGGVSVAAVSKRKEIFLVKQYRYAYGGYTFELIGGGVGTGERPLEAAKKELGEEAGLRADRWIKYNEIYAATESIKIKIHMFLAQGLHEATEKFHSENNMSVLKVPLEKAVSLVMDGKVPLASSAAGILMVNKIINLQ